MDNDTDDDGIVETLDACIVLGTSKDSYGRCGIATLPYRATGKAVAVAAVEAATEAQGRHASS
jgi:hypothetical protein